MKSYFNQSFLFLANTRPTIEIQFLVGGMDGIFSFCHRVETVTGTHPVSYPTGTGGFFPGVKRSGHEANHSHSSAGLKNAWNYISVHPTDLHCVVVNYARDNVLMARCLVKHRDKFTFTLRRYELCDDLEHKRPTVKSPYDNGG